MEKTASDVYGEWRASLLKGFTTADMNVCSQGSVYFFGLADEAVIPILCSRMSASELFNCWYDYYSDMVKRAPDEIVPKFTKFYSVTPADMSGNWAFEEFVMENIGGANFIKTLGRRQYAKMPLPTLENVGELCKQLLN